MDTEQIPATRIEVGHVIRRVDGREVEWHVWNVWLNEETINIRYWSSDDCVRIHAFAADAKVVVSPKKLDAKTFLRIRLQRLQKGKRKEMGEESVNKPKMLPIQQLVFSPVPFWLLFMKRLALYVVLSALMSPFLIMHFNRVVFYLVCFTLSICMLVVVHHLVPSRVLSINNYEEEVG